MWGALATGAVAFLLSSAIQSEERVARKQLSCACHKRVRYGVDDDGNVTEFLAMAGSPSDEEAPRKPCPICHRGPF